MRAFGVVALAGLSVVLTGCSQAPRTTACGFSLTRDQFPLEVLSASSAHPAIAVCVGSTCSPDVPSAERSQGLIGGTTSGGSEATLRFVSSGRWTFSHGSGPLPSTITVFVDSVRARIATRTVALSWHRSPQSDACHTWRTVDPVTIAVP